MMRVFLNPGHDLKRDSVAVNPTSGLRECDVAADIGGLVKGYLEQAGCEVQMLQSDNLLGETPSLPCVVDEANGWPADLFVSLHCNAANGSAQGTETLVYNEDGESAELAGCIQSQIVTSLGTVDRGIKERPMLIVLKHTNMPAVLVEMAFVDNDEDTILLTYKADEMARAIARGITDFEGRNA
jgi:N-acetylmuramoyl-L-alanine amidase